MSYDFNHQEENLEMNTKGYEDLNTTSNRTEQRAFKVLVDNDRIDRIMNKFDRLFELQDSEKAALLEVFKIGFEALETERRASLEEESVIKLQSLARGFIARQKHPVCVPAKETTSPDKCKLSLVQSLNANSYMDKLLADRMNIGMVDKEAISDNAKETKSTLDDYCMLIRGFDMSWAIISELVIAQFIGNEQEHSNYNNLIDRLYFAHEFRDYISEA